MKNDSREQWALSVLNGEARGFGPSLLRAGLQLVEPFYAGAMAMRNTLYASGMLKSHRAARPVVSVGNLTTGGTGKTPVVRWLAERLASHKLRPAILTRGYRGNLGIESDEARLLSDALGDRAAVIVNPDRVAGAASAMAASPSPDVFLLDDGFQHRRLRRDFDLVLINAAEPFGFGHILPRGLRREPIGGLARADAFVVTRADTVSVERLESITSTLHRHNPHAAVYVADHVHAALLTRENETLPMATLSTRRFFAFSGIANPESLRRQFESRGQTFAGFRALPDHHAYTAADLRELDRQARESDAEWLVTTEKDWVKVRSLDLPADVLPIVRTQLEIRFRERGGEDLLARILSRITAQSESAAAPASATPGAGKVP